MIELNETVVTAYAKREHCPGWTNPVVCVIIQDTTTGRLRELCLHERDHGPAIGALFNIAMIVHDEFRRVVERRLEEAAQ